MKRKRDWRENFEQTLQVGDVVSKTLLKYLLKMYPVLLKTKDVIELSTDTSFKTRETFQKVGKHWMYVRSDTLFGGVLGKDLRIDLHETTSGKNDPAMCPANIDQYAVDTATFQKELTHLINKYNIEQHIDMPDYLLAEMLDCFIKAIGPSIRKTLTWHGCSSVCHTNPQELIDSIHEVHSEQFNTNSKGEDMFREGQKVRYEYNDAAFDNADLDDPRDAGLLDGEIYTVEAIEVHSEHTRVWLEGISGCFNSVHFEEF